jgi:hypothetical protein
MSDPTPHPFFDFIQKIGKNPAALKAFVADPMGDPAAAALTREQKEALLSADFSRIDTLVRAENPHFEHGAALTPGAQIGWNMFQIDADILAARAALAKE